MEDKIPNRLQRLAYCRNKYLEWLRESSIDVDFVLVIDLDRLNRKLIWKSIESVLSSGIPWDVAFANQTKLYYDLFALRHSTWNHQNPFKYKTFLLGLGYSEFESGRRAISQRMLKIDRRKSPIKVVSAFGGAAIYRRNCLNSGSYHFLDQNLEETCEHVPLHEELCRQGKNLYIFPSFINAKWTEHTWKQATLLKALRLPLRSAARLFHVFHSVDQKTITSRL
jgi:hypothetical protein